MIDILFCQSFFLIYIYKNKIVNKHLILIQKIRKNLCQFK